MYHIISLGGSILAPKGIDTAFLNKFLTTIKNHKCIIVVGGGKLARDLMKVTPMPTAAKDHVGIAVTHVHAEIVIGAMQQKGMKVSPNVLGNPHVSGVHQFVVAGGFQPGRTTDDIAVQIAVQNDIPSVINLTNVDGIYTRDPKKRGAKHIRKVSFAQFEKMFPKHKPGLHAPFDPVAAQRAKLYKKSIYIINGKTQTQLKNLLENKKTWKGSILGN